MTENARSAQVACRLGCSPGVAFSAWTDPRVLPLWLAPPPYDLREATVEARLGGTYRHHTFGPDDEHLVQGQFLDFEPGRVVRMTWLYRGPNPAPRPEATIVTVEFDGDESGTEVRLTHAELRDATEQTHYREGWAGCFVRLREVYPSPD